jgi:hypothetical protein
MFDNLRIFTILNHVNKVTAKEIGFGFFVIRENKLKSFLNEMPKTRISLAVFLGNLVDDFL